MQRNVFGGPLRPCCTSPVTGFFRDGYCRACEEDLGAHWVCAEMTEEFLKFSVSRGNDLVTPAPDFDFPGLKPGDRWCICTLRWKEAYDEGVAPPVVLNSTHEAALELVDLELLRQHATA